MLAKSEEGMEGSLFESRLYEELRSLLECVLLGSPAIVLVTSSGGMSASLFGSRS